MTRTRLLHAVKRIQQSVRGWPPTATLSNSTTATTNHLWTCVCSHCSPSFARLYNSSHKAAAMFSTSSNLWDSKDSMTANTTEDNCLLDELFTEAQRRTILKNLNELQPVSLKGAKISPSQQSKIIADRPFTALAQVLRLHKMTIVTAERLCRKLLSASEINQTELPSSKDATPVVTSQAAKSIETVTFLDIHIQQTYAVTVKVVGSELDLLERKVIANTTYRKYHQGKIDHLAYVTEAKNILSALTESDAYVLKSSMMRATLTGKVNFALYAIKLLETSFYSLLSANDRVHLYTMLPRVVERDFQLRLGGESIFVTKQVEGILSDRKWKRVTLSDPDSARNQLLTCDDVDGIDKLQFLFLQAILFANNFLVPFKEELLHVHATEDKST